MRLPTLTELLVALMCGTFAFLIAHVAGVPFLPAAALFLLGNVCAQMLRRVRK
jgi:hypothetical protein